MSFIDDIVSGIMPGVMDTVGTSATLLRTTPAPAQPVGFTFQFDGGEIADLYPDGLVLTGGNGNWALSDDDSTSTLEDDSRNGDPNTWILNVHVIATGHVTIYKSDKIENKVPPTNVLLWDLSINGTGDTMSDISQGSGGGPTSYPMKITPPQRVVNATSTGQLLRSLQAFAVMTDPAIFPDPTTDDVTIGPITYNLEAADPVMSGALVAGWTLTLGR